jgi:hypothetical protein
MRKVQKLVKAVAPARPVARVITRRRVIGITAPMVILPSAARAFDEFREMRVMGNRVSY